MGRLRHHGLAATPGRAVVSWLGFIAEEPERLAGFLHSSGLAVEQIRDAAQEPRFLVGVLEHMLADESLLVAFATSAGVDPAAIGQARAALASNGERRLS